MKNLIAAFIALTICAPVFAYVPLKDTPIWPTSRNHLDWPFTADSFINKPIGEDAVYINLQFPEMQQWEVNYEHIVNADSADPFVPYYACKDGAGACFPPTGRCSGTVPILPDGTPTNVQLPSNWILPELGYCSDVPGETEQDCSSDNPASWTIPGDNNEFMYSNGGTARCVAGGPIYGQIGAFSLNKTNLKGDGYEAFGGRYGGSAITVRGLTIKAHDILSDEPIPHAGALWVQPVIHYYDPNASSNHRWPARRSDADNWWDANYGNITPMNFWDPTQLVSNTIPGFVMGALLAIPHDVTPESIGIQTAAGLKFFNMAQDYGLYTVNSAEAWSGNLHRTAIAHTPEAVEAFKQKYGHTVSWHSVLSGNYLYADPNTAWGRWASDVNAIWRSLHLVDDSTATNIGGAGIRRTRPPAPAFGGVVIAPPGPGTIDNITITP